MIVVAIIGILAAIAIPNFIKFQARTKQAEPKANLKSLYTAQRVAFTEYDSYLSVVSNLGFNPERGNRYFIVVGCSTLSSRASALEYTSPADCGFAADTYKGFAAITSGSIANITATAASSASGTCLPIANVGCLTDGNNGAFLALSAGNIDNDSTIDTWAVSSMTLTIAASAAPGSDAEAQFHGPGIPSNNIDDNR